jgi:hypothetical protein
MAWDIRLSGADVLLKVYHDRAKKISSCAKYKLWKRSDNKINEPED